MLKALCSTKPSPLQPHRERTVSRHNRLLLVGCVFLLFCLLANCYHEQRCWLEEQRFSFRRPQIRLGSTPDRVDEVAPQSGRNALA